MGFLGRGNNFSNEEEEIYRYGLQVGLEMLLYLMCCFSISVVIGMVKEFFFFFGIFYSIRSYAGGLHMNSYIKCLSVSCIVFVVTMLLAKYFNMKICVSMCLIMVSLCLIYILVLKDDGEPNELNFYIKGIKRSICCILLLCSFLAIGRQYQILTVVAFTLIMILISKVLDLVVKIN
ncbi:accessory gene regulator B family protein [Mediterraneibacter agrestimuris]|uniref:accessory gene regulator B family protein n=1 Tax=Mediterraneibacter agrestimuris TaxID=2941333 RepID=UPI0038CC06C9